MKKDRNCGCPGAVGMQGAVPYGMGVPMMPNGAVPYPASGMMIPTQGMGVNVPGMNQGMNYDTDGITGNQAVTAVEQLQAQINNLDRRVSRLESQLQDTKSTSFNSNKYTDSNYHMM